MGAVPVNWEDVPRREIEVGPIAGTWRDLGVAAGTSWADEVDEEQTQPQRQASAQAPAAAADDEDDGASCFRLCWRPDRVLSMLPLLYA